MIYTKIGNQKETIKKFGVMKIAVFGSYARGEQTEDSDVDLLVEFGKGKKNYANFINLAYYMEDLLGKKVEIVTPEGMSPHIKPYIVKELKYVSLDN